MTIFFFSVKVTPTSETELKEVAAPDFLKAVQTLAAWRPGVHILKLEGIHMGSTRKGPQVLVPCRMTTLRVQTGRSEGSHNMTKERVSCG